MRRLFQLVVTAFAIVAVPVRSHAKVVIEVLSDRTNSLASAEAWLAARAAEMVRSARRTMPDGTIVFAPQTSDHYNATRLSDFEFMLEAEAIPKADIVPAARVFLNGISPEGYGVNCVKYDGTPVYQPGYGTMGANPISDGSQYTVSVMYLAWRQTGDASLLSTNVLDRLLQSFSVIPHNPNGGTGLVWIDPAQPWDRSSFGFTDTVRKQGDCLYESLLEIQAGRRLCEMLAAAGRAAEASALSRRIGRLRETVVATFWDPAVGLYRAATVKCREHDVWGSAFAVWLGVAPEAHADAIAAYFADNYSALVQNGQVRHCARGEYWEAACARDTYQNGGYWGTPVAWFSYALERKSPTLVNRLYRELVADYGRRGISEWTLGDAVSIPEGFLGSAMWPLAGLRRILAERGGKPSLETIRNWFEMKASEIVPKGRRAMDSGVHGYVPQTGSNYDAIWLRDYYYVLEGEAIPTNDVVTASTIFLNGISPEGYGVDCVRYNGTPIYKPGYGTMGENPVADGPQFTILTIHEAWRQSGEASFLATNVLDRLLLTLSTLPHNPSGGTGLVWIDPSKAWDRCPYGFTDSIRKQGDCLFESLLEIDASRRLAEMLAAAGRSAEAAVLRARADAETAQVNGVFWDDEKGLYRAATVKCREHDVWGSAFAVWLGVAPSARMDRIAAYFRDHFDGLVQHGQVRHCAPGVYWEQGCARDTYQNGAFWGTPVGWFAYALERVSPQLVDRLYADLYAFYRVHGVCEWSFGSTIAIPEGYLANVAQPLVGLRRILAERR